MTDITYAGYRPGALGRICELQSAYYGREWEFGAAYETKVAGDMAEFLGRFDPDRDMFLTALKGDSIEGGITIDGPNADGWVRLRWFIVSEALRGSCTNSSAKRKSAMACRVIDEITLAKRSTPWPNGTLTRRSFH